MDGTNVWTGPAITNPRNRVTNGWRHGTANETEQTVDGLALLRGDASVDFCVLHAMPSGIALHRHDELIVCQGVSVAFVGWERSEYGSLGWRVAYRVTSDLAAGTFVIDRIDVAPDRDDGSEPPALPA